MNKIKKYSLVGSTLTALLVVAVVSINGGSFEAEAVIGPESSTEKGLIGERMSMGLQTGFDERLYVVHITSGDPES